MSDENHIEIDHMMLALQLYAQSLLQGETRMVQAAKDAKEMILARRHLYHYHYVAHIQANGPSVESTRLSIEGRINVILNNYILELQPARGPLWRIQLSGAGGLEILVPR